jgi:hypothetical protein
MASQLAGCFGLSFFRSGTGEELSGGNVLRLIQIRLAEPSLDKLCQLVKPIRRQCEPPIRVRQTPSTFHPRAQRTAFRHRDVRQQ